MSNAPESPLPGIPTGTNFLLKLENLSVSEATSGASVIVFDLGETETAEEAEPKREGDTGPLLICYFSMGTREDFRTETDLPSPLWNPDPDDSAGAGARPVPGYEGEFWVHTPDRALLVGAIRSRIDQCADAGADGVLPDMVDSYLLGATAGFEPPNTAQDAYELARAVAEAAHNTRNDDGKQMMIGLHGFHEAAGKLADLYDFAVVDQCLALRECSAFRPFEEQGKAVLDVEYVRGADDWPLQPMTGQSVKELCNNADPWLSVLLTSIDYDEGPFSCAEATAPERPPED